jgi:adenine/guanine phosphoribosyltransferase-like PRPP-binding protein
VGLDITKEYGKDKIFFRISDVAAGKLENGVFNVTFFDDILATGGTAVGIAEGLQGQKVVLDGKEYPIKVTDFVFLVEILGLGGREACEAIAPVKSIMQVTE